MLEEFLDTNAGLFADDYLVIKIDIQTMEHGDDVGKELRGDRNGGIPWMAILNDDGVELISSDGPSGNIGCPITEQECAYFVTMIETTMRHASQDRLTEIARALDEHAQKRR